MTGPKNRRLRTGEARRLRPSKRGEAVATAPGKDAGTPARQANIGLPPQQAKIGLAGDPAPKERRAKRGEARCKPRPLKIDRLPQAMRDRICEERIKGKSWKDIERESPDWKEWFIVSDEVLALFPGRRLKNKQTSLWHDLRIEQTLKKTVEDGERARRLAESFAGRYFKDMDAAVRTALFEQVFQLILEAGNQELTRQNLAKLAGVMAKLDKARLDCVRREREQAELEARNEEAQGASPREVYLQVTLDVLTRLRAHRLVCEALDPLRDELVAEFDHAADEFTEKPAEVKGAREPFSSALGAVAPEPALSGAEGSASAGPVSAPQSTTGEPVAPQPADGDVGATRVEAGTTLSPAWRGRAAARDLPTFLREAWPILQPGRPLVWSWHYDLLCEYLTLVKERQIRRLIINVPPRTAKSTIATICFPCWVWATEANHAFLCASYSRELSTEHSVARRHLIQSDWYQQRWGKRFALAADQNLKTQFDNDRRGQMIATSVGGTATGKGGDTLIVDDPLSADQALSDAERKSANGWFDGTLRSRLNNPATGAIVIIMQRLHELDLTGFLLATEGAAPLLTTEYTEYTENTENTENMENTEKEKEGANSSPSVSSASSVVSEGAGRWTHLKLPLEAEADERWEYPISHTVHKRRTGDILQPERFTPAVVAALKSRGIIFAGQYQQRPAPLEGNLIKRQQVHYYGGVDPATGQADAPLPEIFDMEIVSADCSFKDLETSDFVAIGRIGVKGRKRYLLNVINAHLGMSATEAQIRREREGRKVSAILVEDKANGSAVIERLRRNLPGVVAVNPEGGKLARFMAAAPEWEAGDWYVDRNAAWTEPLIQQLTTFPNAAHDDMADMMSQASIWLQTRTGGIIRFWLGMY